MTTPKIESLHWTDDKQLNSITIMSDKDNADSEKLKYNPFVKFTYYGINSYYYKYNSLISFLKQIAKDNKESTQGVIGRSCMEFELVVLDIDENAEENYKKFCKSNLPKPSFVLYNKVSKHYQIQWLLNKPEYFEGTKFTNYTLKELKERHYQEELTYIDKWHNRFERGTKEHKSAQLQRNIENTNHKSYNTLCESEDNIGLCNIKMSERNRYKFTFISTLINCAFGDSCFRGPQCKNPFTLNENIEKIQFDETLTYSYDELLKSFIKYVNDNRKNIDSACLVKSYYNYNSKLPSQYKIEWIEDLFIEQKMKAKESSNKVKHFSFGSYESIEDILNDSLLKRNDTVLQLSCFLARKLGKTIYKDNLNRELLKQDIESIVFEYWSQIMMKNTKGVYNESSAKSGINWVVYNYNPELNQNKEIRRMYAHISRYNQSFENFKRLNDFEDKLREQNKLDCHSRNIIKKELNLTTNQYYYLKKLKPNYELLRPYMLEVAVINLRNKFKEINDLLIKNTRHKLDKDNLLESYFNICLHLEKDNKIWGIKNPIGKQLYYLTVNEMNWFMKNLTDEEKQYIESKLDLENLYKNTSILGNVNALADESQIKHQAMYDREHNIKRMFINPCVNSTRSKTMNDYAKRNVNIYRLYRYGEC